MEVALDLIAATRTADAPAFQGLERRLAALTFDQSLLMTRQFAHTVGVRVGQLFAQKASGDFR